MTEMLDYLGPWIMDHGSWIIDNLGPSQITSDHLGPFKASVKPSQTIWDQTEVVASFVKFQVPDRGPF